MKFVLSGLNIGDPVVGKVVENLPDFELIISFNGDLLRVQNESGRTLRVGDHVTLTVKAIQPLQFQLMSDRAEQRKKGHIDINV